MELLFEPEPTEATPRRYPRWLLALAATPWLVIAAFLVVARPATTPPMEIAAPLDTCGVPSQPVPATQPKDATPLEAPQPTALQTDTFAHSRTAFESYAIIAALDYFNAIRQENPRVEFTQSVVEQIDFTSPTVPTATVVLNFRIEGQARTARLAVPMTVTPEGAVTHLALYPVATPERGTADYFIDMDVDTFTPLNSTELITRALQDAGYRNFTVDGAVTKDDWPIIALVDMVADTGETVSYTIFLHDTHDGLVVAGQPSPTVAPLSNVKAAR